MKGDVEKKERFSFAFFEDRIRFAFLSLSLSLSLSPSPPPNQKQTISWISSRRFLQRFFREQCRHPSKQKKNKEKKKKNTNKKSNKLMGFYGLKMILKNVDLQSTQRWIPRLSQQP